MTKQSRCSIGGDEDRAGGAHRRDMDAGGFACGHPIGAEDGGNDSVMLLPGLCKTPKEPELGALERRQPASRHDRNLKDIIAVRAFVEPARRIRAWGPLQQFSVSAIVLRDA